MGTTTAFPTLVGFRVVAVALAVMALIALVVGQADAGHLTGVPATYTLDADFDEGTLINVVHVPSDQLQLSNTTSAFNFIWVAVSTKGTVVKINTLTGVVLGEYSTNPDNAGAHNPSRTTVDQNGNVWVTNRNASIFVSANGIAPGVPPVNRSMGTVARIGLEENGQCVDRNGNGMIDTSTGLADVRAWPNVGGVNTFEGVSTAADECIINYTLINSTGARHVSVDGNNDVWAGGTGGRHFDLLDGTTGQIIRQEPSVGYGGYGGLIAPNGVIWSARSLLRWDTANPLTGFNGDPVGQSIGPPILGRNWSGQGGDSYGLCINPNNGEVWNTRLSNNLIDRYAADGTHIATYNHGFYYAQGCVIDGNGDVWVAHSILGGGNTVGHLLGNGTFVGNVAVGSGPTGVAVDAAGLVWATNYYSMTVSRIDPTAGPIGGGGVPIGLVNFTSGNLGGNLYNYSDMAGSTLLVPRPTERGPYRTTAAPRARSGVRSAGARPSQETAR